jgi:hypothetical protein
MFKPMRFLKSGTPSPHRFLGKRQYNIRLSFECFFLSEKIVRLFGYIFQNITGLAVQNLADGFEGIESDALGFARFQDGQIGWSDV